MAKRALCVGCNYPTNSFSLSGAVNDAFLVADTLQKSYGFKPRDIQVLHDVYPGQARSSQHLVQREQRPTRVNILRGLRDLVQGAVAGDVLFFSFSGFGVQVDDLSTPQNEGYDDAILPSDFRDGPASSTTSTTSCVIYTNDIHDVLMGVPSGCVVMALMDCDHATSLIDVSGTLDGKLVSGLRIRGLCGVNSHGMKMQLARHRQDVWQGLLAQQLKAMPRFQPLLELEPRQSELPTRPSMSRSGPLAFCMSAAGHGQTALELELSRTIDGCRVKRQHGVLSWAFAQAADVLSPSATYLDLAAAIRTEMRHIQQQRLPSMDQEALLTFAVPHSKPGRMRVLQAAESTTPACGGTGTGTTGIGTGTAANPTADQRLSWQVVPPPPPGLIAAGKGKSQEELTSQAAAGMALLRATLQSSPGAEAQEALKPAWTRQRQPPSKSEGRRPSVPCTLAGEAAPPRKAASPPEPAQRQTTAAQAAFLTCAGDVEVVRNAGAAQELQACRVEPLFGVMSTKTSSASSASTCSTCDAASPCSEAESREEEDHLKSLQVCCSSQLRSFLHRAFPNRALCGPLQLGLGAQAQAH